MPTVGALREAQIMMARAMASPLTMHDIARAAVNAGVAVAFAKAMARSGRKRREIVFLDEAGPLGEKVYAATEDAH